MKHIISFGYEGSARWVRLKVTETLERALMIQGSQRGGTPKRNSNFKSQSWKYIFFLFSYFKNSLSRTSKTASECNRRFYCGWRSCWIWRVSVDGSLENNYELYEYTNFDVLIQFFSFILTKGCSWLCKL